MFLSQRLGFILDAHIIIVRIEGSTFKDYRPFTVQDIEIKLNNVRYLLARWETPSGKILVGKLPNHVKGHFGNVLISYSLYQNYHNHVTQPLLLEELREFGIKISGGQLNRILIKNKDHFHQEKTNILASALTNSDYINVDDTGTRHKGKNGYVTHIGNEFFAWFESTSSKSRINFLELLRAGHNDYQLNGQALDYMADSGLALKSLAVLGAFKGQGYDNKQVWETFLDQQQISAARHRQIATEGALLGSVFSHGISPNLAVISDDAGQFNILSHGLCWIHAERAIKKIISFSDQQKQIIEDILDQIWQLYQDLKEYKNNPDPIKKIELRFDLIFNTKKGYRILDQALKRLYRNKSELLLVLERPEIPLHNNTSERDIRDFVKKRKISAGTRSDDGRKARDTFLSLKKTSCKLGLSFWTFLKDRVYQSNQIPSLGELVVQKINPP